MSKDKLLQLKELINNADAILIGAGSGLSTSAGYVYSEEEIKLNFSDFAAKYGFNNLYRASFYNFPTQEEFWAFWSRMIYYKRYCPVPKPEVFENLLKVVEGKDYFVLTTNVDHVFQRMGFDKSRLFYTQGDLGLWQCKKPCHHKTYDNEEQIMEMFEKQQNMQIPTDLIPHCPVCGGVMSPNLRADSTFVQDRGWYKAAERYEDFVVKHRHSNIVYLDLGTGYNTPGIIKYPFIHMTNNNENANYVIINLGQADINPQITERSLAFNDDIGAVLQALVEVM